jgi:hypothetical protein
MPTAIRNLRLNQARFERAQRDIGQQLWPTVRGGAAAITSIERNSMNFLPLSLLMVHSPSKLAGCSVT